MSDYYASADAVASDPHLSIKLNDNHWARNRGTKPIEESSSKSPEKLAKEARGATSRAEEWLNLVTRLAAVLVDCGLGDVQMIIEYGLYGESANQHKKGGNVGPVDVVLAGIHPDNGEPSVVLVELKRWSRIQSVPTDPLKVDYGCGAKEHPATQVDGYRTNVRKHLAVFGNRYIGLVALAYLPNLTRFDDQWITEYSPHPDVHVITGGEPDTIRRFLTEHLAPGDGTNTVRLLLDSPVLDARPLEHQFGAVVRNKINYNLIDAQQEAFDQIIARLARTDGTLKTAFLIQGEAGTGKSVLAAQLAQWAHTHGLKWAFVSGGRSSRETFKHNASGFGKRFMPLIRLAEQYSPDDLDLVICDEAQAMPEFPIKNSFRVQRLGETSVEVILSRARVPVFLADGNQRVRPDELWPPERIARHVRKTPNVLLARRTLDLPLRGMSSRSYQTWVRRLLGDSAPQPLTYYHPDEPFQVYVAPSPVVMEMYLRASMTNGCTARITAGYAFPWSKPNPDGTLVDDIAIGDWTKPWNAPDTIRGGGAVPRGELWATADGGFEQVGCVYTCRGLEYDWGGVIFGRDLVWRDNQWHADPAASHDKKAKINTSATDWEQQIRNAYRTMLMRSMSGTVVYSVDEATQRLFQKLLPPLPSA